MGPLILHSHNMSGGVAERYCSSLLASRRFTRGWGFESLRLRIGQQPHPWQLWCNGNTVDRGSAIDGSIPSSCPKALVAQWIAHQFPEQGVAGSSPAKGAHATPQASAAQRIECQSTKLVMGVRFSPGVLSFAISLRPAVMKRRTPSGDRTRDPHVISVPQRSGVESRPGLQRPAGFDSFACRFRAGPPP